MIKRIDLSLSEQYFAYCSDSPFGIRMVAALKSYGTDCRFADFWLVLEDEKIVGAISKLDGDLTLCAECANDEIREFIGVIGAQTVTCEKSLLSQLGFENFDCQGAIMRYAGGENAESNLPIEAEPSIMSVCRLLCECEGESIRVGEFDRFYTDLSLRVRRGTAVCYAYDNKGVAVASALTDGGAIIGGVAVRQSERKSGIGRALVKRLVSDLAKEKEIYLLRLENENESFYKKLGFENIGSWASFSRGCE